MFQTLVGWSGTMPETDNCSDNVIVTARWLVTPNGECHSDARLFWSPNWCRRESDELVSPTQRGIASSVTKKSECHRDARPFEPPNQGHRLLGRRSIWGRRWLCWPGFSSYLCCSALQEKIETFAASMGPQLTPEIDKQAADEDFRHGVRIHSVIALQPVVIRI